MKPIKTLSVKYLFFILILFSIILSFFPISFSIAQPPESLWIGWDFSSQINPVLSMGNKSGYAMNIIRGTWGKTETFGYIGFSAKISPPFSWGYAESSWIYSSLSTYNFTLRIKFYAESNQSDQHQSNHVIAYAQTHPLSTLYFSIFLNGYAGKYSLIMQVNEYAMRYDNIMPNQWYDISFCIYQTATKQYMYMLQHVESGLDIVLGSKKLDSYKKITIPGSWNVKLGARDGTSFDWAFNGKVAFIKIYKYADNPEKLAPIKGWYHFDEPAGSTKSEDSSGLGNTLEWKVGKFTGGVGLYELSTKLAQVVSGDYWAFDINSGYYLLAKTNLKIENNDYLRGITMAYFQYGGDSDLAIGGFRLKNVGSLISATGNWISSWRVCVYGVDSGLRSVSKKLTDTKWIMLLININSTGSFIGKLYASNGTLIDQYSSSFTGTADYNIGGYYGLYSSTVYAPRIDEFKVVYGYYTFEQMRYPAFSPYANETYVAYAYSVTPGEETVPTGFSIRFDPPRLVFNKIEKKYFCIYITSSQTMTVGIRFSTTYPGLYITPGVTYIGQNFVPYVNLTANIERPVWVGVNLTFYSPANPAGNHTIYITFEYLNGTVFYRKNYPVDILIGTEPPTGKVSAAIASNTILFTEKDVGIFKPLTISISSSLDYEVDIRYTLNATVENVVGRWCGSTRVSKGSTNWKADEFMLSAPANFTEARKLIVYASFFNMTSQKTEEVKILDTILTFKAICSLYYFNKTLKWEQTRLSVSPFEPGKTITIKNVLTVSMDSVVRFNVVNEAPDEYTVILRPEEIDEAGSHNVDISITATEAITNNTFRNIYIRAYYVDDINIYADFNITVLAIWYRGEKEKSFNGECDVYLKPSIVTLKWLHGVYDVARVEVWLDDRITRSDIFSQPLTAQLIYVLVDYNENFEYMNGVKEGGFYKLTQLETVESLRCYYLWFKIRPYHTAGNNTYKLNVLVYLRQSKSPDPKDIVEYKKYLTLTIMTEVQYKPGEEIGERPGVEIPPGGGTPGVPGGNYSMVGAGSIIPSISGTPSGAILYTIQYLDSFLQLGTGIVAFLLGLIIIGICMYAGFKVAGLFGTVIMGLMGLVLSIMLGLISFYMLILVIASIVAIFGVRIFQGRRT